MRICDEFCFFGPLVSLKNKKKKNMWKSIIFNKSTEISAPPQVFLSFHEANGLEL